MFLTITLRSLEHEIRCRRFFLPTVPHQLPPSRRIHTTETRQRIYLLLQLRCRLHHIGNNQRRVVSGFLGQVACKNPGSTWALGTILIQGEGKSRPQKGVWCQTKAIIRTTQIYFSKHHCSRWTPIHEKSVHLLLHSADLFSRCN